MGTNGIDAASSFEGRTGRKASVAAFLATIALLIAGALALAGCSSPAPSPSAPASGDTGADTSGTESTALVVFANGNDVLFVDQHTETPYFPTIPAEGITALDGSVITADDLEVGNVVAVTGNDIMLESYPGQYPGITSIRVIQKGDPSDAEQYSSIVDQVFAPVDPTSTPTGSVSYRTDMANTTLLLEPYSYQWASGADGQDVVAADGWFADDNGLIAEGTPDAIIAEATEATAAFDRGFQSLEVNRWPLSADSDGRKHMDLTAPQQPVDHTTEESGTAAFTIEPGYAYSLSVKFANGEASFAFIATT